MPIKVIKKGSLPLPFPQEVYCGDGWPLYGFAIKYVGGGRLPLADIEIICQIKRNADDTTPVKELTKGNGFKIVDDFCYYDTDVDIPAGVYPFDIQILIPGRRKLTYFRDKVTVLKDITRP